MRKLFKLCAVVTLAALCTHCGNNRPKNEAKPAAIEQKVAENSIYHWKSTFELDSLELDFIKRHNISRIYTKMFDIAVEHSFVSSALEPVPIATTQFVSIVPEGVEIVPVVYITIEALKSMVNREAEYAELIVERIVAMCNYNNLGAIHEIQFDCDWTESTIKSYVQLCSKASNILDKRGIDLSITLRLHQLAGDVPKVDRAVLMLYNTGALKNPKTRNSILDIVTVKPYVKRVEFPYPLDYAYPAFGWGVKFKDGKFQAIVSENESVVAKDETIRKERPTAEDILKVKRLVESVVGKPDRGSIIYHLDNSQLKNYDDDEIAKIFAY
jgi:hypothetical protein